MRETASAVHLRAHETFSVIAAPFCANGEGKEKATERIALVAAAFVGKKYYTQGPPDCGLIRMRVMAILAHRRSDRARWHAPSQLGHSDSGFVIRPPFQSSITLPIQI
jgi:hypothetical protein